MVCSILLITLRLFGHDSCVCVCFRFPILTAQAVTAHSWRRSIARRLSTLTRYLNDVNFQMENPSDDPRDFYQHIPGPVEMDHDPSGLGSFMRMSFYASTFTCLLSDVLGCSVNLQSLMAGGASVGDRSNPNRASDRRNQVRNALCLPKFWTEFI
jgi:hypothetical protein